jgi:hypothetical protein
MSLCLFFPQTTADPLVYNLKSFSLSRNARFPHRGLLNCQFHSGLCRNETSGFDNFMKRVTIESGDDPRVFSGDYADKIKIFVNDACVYDSTTTTVFEPWQIEIMDSSMSGQMVTVAHRKPKRTPLDVLREIATIPHKGDGTDAMRLALIAKDYLSNAKGEAQPPAKNL